jgi:hypothetical protein
VRQDEAIEQTAQRTASRLLPGMGHGLGLKGFGAIIDPECLVGDVKHRQFKTTPKGVENAG